MSAKGDHSWVLEQHLAAKSPDYPRACGATEALLCVLGILLRRPSDNAERDIEEIRRAVQDGAQRFKTALGEEHRPWDYVPHRLRVIREG